MTRRTLIRRALTLLAWVPGALTACARAGGVGRPGAATPAPPGAPATGALSTGEIESVVAFAEGVVEGRTLSDVERRPLVDHIADVTGRSESYRSLYQTAARTLDRVAGRPFATLEMRDRLGVIAHHGLAGTRAATDDDGVRTVRTRIVPDLVRTYYGSAAGWAVVDYDTFPGRCGDLARYTRAEP